MPVRKVKKLFRFGGSLAVILPKYWLNSKGLKKGDCVELLVSDEKIVVRPLKRADEGSQEAGA